MTMKKPTIKAHYKTTYHRDGTVSYWDVLQQQWVCTRPAAIPPNVLATLSDQERRKLRRMADAALMEASEILAQVGMTLGTASVRDVELAYRLADDGGTIQAGDMIRLVGYSDPTKHTATSLPCALHMIGCEDADAE